MGIPGFRPYLWSRESLGQQQPTFTGTDNPLTLTNVAADMALTAGFRVETCFGDGDSDGDVDGLDLKGVSFDSGLFEMDRFAENFGRVNCF